MSNRIVLLKYPEPKKLNKKSTDAITKAHYNIDLTHKSDILLAELNDKVYCIRSRYSDDETRKIVKFRIDSFDEIDYPSSFYLRADAVKYNF